MMIARAEKDKIKPILEKGEKYSRSTTTKQFFEFPDEIREWANKANSIEIDLRARKDERIQ